MTKKYFKKALSFLLVLLMVVGMLPTTVFAAEETEPAGTVKYGHYENGQWVEGAPTQSLPDGLQSVDKTARKLEDNTYEITLKVVAEKTNTSVAPNAAATVLVIDRSGSMGYCAECGGSGRHKSNCSHYSRWGGNSVTADQSRMAATKNAAYSFLDSYKGEATADRWVCIVSFATNVSTSAWFDVATSSGMESAKSAVSAISANGGTYLQGGLAAAQTALGNSTVSMVAGSAKNVVALTDGVPTYSANHGNGSNGSQAINSETAAQAAELQALASVYTVCFGAANDTTYSGGPKVGDFLRDSIATDASKAFNADNTAELNAAFEAIVENITSGLDGDGLPVVDGAAPFITANVDGAETTEGFTWNLGTPVVETRTENGVTITTYTYTKVYTVTLDANNADFEEGQWYPLNGETYLTMADGTRVDFPIPAGQGVKTRYTVTWVDDDGTELEKDENVPHGTMPSYDSAEPAKEATAEYTYVFTGWAPEIEPVTANVTYTAQYKAVKNAYTVRWVNDDGTELEVDENVEYGTMPEYNGAAPTKAATAQYTYKFAGWTPEISPVTGNITYTARYDAVTNAYTVRWVNWDNTLLELDEDVLYGATPSYDGATPAKPATAEYTYVFTGWNPAVSPVTGDITYTAQYEAVKNAYTVTWVDEDGTELEKDENVLYGTMPSYDSAKPTKESTAEFNFEFAGWNPEVSLVTGDITYTAQYTAIKRAYTVKWVNDDYTLLELDENVLYGTMPSYDSAEPTKEATAEFTYQFTGWNPEVSPVTGDITYVAQFDHTTNVYTVLWVNEDGTELEKDENVPYGTMPEYNSVKPAKESTAAYSYTFIGWNPTVEPVTGNAVYTAQYEAVKRAYTVTWIDEDGTELEKDENVLYGTMPSYDSAEPTKEATAEFTYIFKGWNPEVSEVTGDITYTAQYRAVTNAYTVTWVNDDGTELEKDENVLYGTMPSYDSAEPTKTATAEFTYIFAGWNPEVSAVTGDITYTAQYEAVKNAYTVTWVDEDGTLLEKDEKVEYGTMPSYDGAEPTKEATAEFTYVFAGWNPEVDTVKGDITYTAQYDAVKNAYTVTWVDEDGTVLEKDEEVEYGTMPSFDGEEPTKKATAEYTYTFDGWNPEVSEVTGDITYTAKYAAVRNTYTITWINDDGTVLEVDENVPYGQTPTYDGRTPAKEATSKYTYKFDKWSPEVVAVTGNATYTATYQSTAVKPADNQSTGVKTGDESHIVLWSVCLLASAMGAVLCVSAKKRKSCTK